MNKYNISVYDGRLYTLFNIDITKTQFVVVNYAKMSMEKKRCNDTQNASKFKV